MKVQREPGPGAGPHVKVFDGLSFLEIRSFYAFDAGFQGGVTVAGGDLNRDGYAEIIVGAASGNDPHVMAFDGLTGAVVQSFLAYDSSYRGGITVASGDIDGDGTYDLITGSALGTSHVKVFSGRTGGLLQSYLAFDPGFIGGIDVSAADVNADGRADIIVGSGAGGGLSFVTRSGLDSSPLNFTRLNSGDDSVGVVPSFFASDSDQSVETVVVDGSKTKLEVFDRKGTPIDEWNAFPDPVAISPIFLSVSVR